MDTGILLETGTNELEILEFHIDGERADGAEEGQGDQRRAVDQAVTRHAR